MKFKEIYLKTHATKIILLIKKRHRKHHPRPCNERKLAQR